jgi:CRP-like cAMP-binding protein
VSKAKEILKQSVPFCEFEKSVRKRFLAEARTLNFSAGDVLYREMTEGDEIYLAVDGRFRMSVELASAHHMVEEIEGGAGELFGEGRFIADGPRPATITAITDLTVLVWDVSIWQDIAEEYPEVGYSLALFAGQVLFGRVEQLRDHLINDMSWGIE